MDKLVDRIRSFNRFYTSMIGVLDKHILESDFSLSEARVLYELSNLGPCSARKIIANMSIDEGYLSRIIERFLKLGLVQKIKSQTDKRSNLLSLTPQGKAQFQKINVASSKAVRKMIANISPKDLQMLLMMMEGIENILTSSDDLANAK